MTDQQRHTADTITDDALDALYAEREELRERFDNQAQAAAELLEERRQLEEQLVAARSTLDRVRALHSRWDASPGDCAHCRTGPGNLVPWPCPTIQALDTATHDDGIKPSKRPHLCPGTEPVAEHMQGCPYEKPQEN